MRPYQRMGSLIRPCQMHFGTGKSWFRHVPATVRTSLASQASKSKMTKRCVVVTLVANKGGFEAVSRAGNGQAGFSAASDTVRKQFAKLPVIASE